MKTLDIGARVELVPMDQNFKEITIGLYRQERDGVPEYLVYSYSGQEGTAQRLSFIVQSMATLADMQITTEGLLRFTCGHRHELACRRAFLEACKLESTTPATVRPLTIFDKKADCDISVTPVGDGVYRVGAQNPDVARRIAAIAGGLIKLGQMDDLATDQVGFPCGQNHDALVGLILVRAPNVRAVMREQEQTSSRGVLAAPSQQE